MWLEAGQVEVRSGSDGRPLLLRCEHVGTDPVRRGTGAVEGEWICFPLWGRTGSSQLRDGAAVP